MKLKDPDLRDRLLRSAATLFAQKGFAATSMDAIGAAAGVTKGGVYMHFQGKEDLFFAVVDDWRDRLRQSWLRTPGRTESGAERLQGFLADHLRFHFDNPQVASLLRVVATELSFRFTAQVREDVRTHQRVLRQQLRELLAVGANDGSLFADDTAFAAFVLAGALDGVVSQWTSAPRDVEPFLDPERIARSLVAAYLTGRRGTRRAPAPVKEEDAGFQPPF
jgi:AcrR family transcriptional regulator